MPLSSTFVLSSSKPQRAVRPGSLIDHIFEHFDSFADRIAVVDDASGRSYSFQRLKQLIGQVASGLVKRGFGKGDVTSLFGANCLENAPIAFGAIAAGGTVHLIKPLASKDELRFHFDLAQPKIIVTTTGAADSVLEALRGLEKKTADVYVIGGAVDGCQRAEELLDDAGDANPWGQVEIDPEEDVAVMLQTGGTTGMSKTVMISHAAMKHATVEHIMEIEASGEKCLGYVPFNHAYSFIIYYVHLQVIHKHKITRLGITPTALITLVTCPLFSKADLSSVRVVLCGGAAMSGDTEAHLLKSFLKAASNAKFSQGYGMTEMSGAATMFPPPSDPGFKRKLGSVGVPKPGVELRVVSCDSQRQSCGPGEMGQILLRSKQVMKGYFQNQEATRKVLTGDKWYDSGDYGYFDEDGYVYVIDRVEDLIRHKEGLVRPTQVEGILRAHPGVRDCTVVGRSCAEGGEVAAAFVVRTEGCDVTEEELKTFVASRLLPRERLCGGVLFVEQLPKSPAGKMLRNGLKRQLEGQ